MLDPLGLHTPGVRSLQIWYDESVSFKARGESNEDRLGMGEYRTPLVEQIVDAELNPPSDDPAKRTVVMVDNIVYEKWVVKLQGIVWDRWYWWWKACGLKDDPYLLKCHCITLESCSTISDSDCLEKKE